METDEELKQGVQVRRIMSHMIRSPCGWNGRDIKVCNKEGNRLSMDRQSRLSLVSNGKRNAKFMAKMSGCE